MEGFGDKHLAPSVSSRSSSSDHRPASSSDDAEIEKRDVTDIIGGYGPWQRNLFVLLFLASIPSSWHNLMMTFMAPPGIDFWCARPPDSDISLERWFNKTKINSCETDILAKNGSVSSVVCTKWEYNSTLYKSTIIQEWDLVCNREWLISFSKSIYNVGYLLAVLVFGQLSDSFGRRPTILVSYVVNVTAGLLSAFATSFAVFTTLRFFIAVGAAGFYTISFVLMVELVSIRHRSTFGLGINLGWCLAFVSLPAVAWVVRDWVWLQLAVTLPKLLFIPVFWMIPESPRWLLINKKIDQFRRTVLSAAVKNGRSEEWTQLEVDKMLLNNDVVAQVRKSTILDIFRTPRLRLHAANLYYNWLVNSFIYFALSYNTEDLAGDLYLNFFANGAVEFPAYMCAIYVGQRLGRKLPLALGMVAGGIACILSVAIPATGYNNWLSVAFALVGKFFITATFAIVYVVTAEIFPTVVRNVGVGTGSTFARIGSIVAPFVKELNMATNVLVSNSTFAALSISSGLLVFFLPETQNIKTTDTIEEAAIISRKQPKDGIPKDYAT